MPRIGYGDHSTHNINIAIYSAIFQTGSMIVITINIHEAKAKLSDPLITQYPVLTRW